MTVFENYIFQQVIKIMRKSYMDSVLSYIKVMHANYN